MTDGQTIFAFASAPLAGVVAGFVFKHHHCVGIICEDVWNKDAGLGVAAVGWLLGVGYEAVVLKNNDMVPWFIGAIVFTLVGLLLS